MMLESAVRRRRGRFRFFLFLISAPVCSDTMALEVELVGKMGAKAVLQIDGGAPRTTAVGARTPEGVKLLSLDGNRAVVEVEGRRIGLDLGTGPIRAIPSNASADLVLHADDRGHFLAEGSVNGASLRFLVDTGASLVSLGASDARRAGIDFRRGTAATSLTAAGPVRVWRVRLDSVRIGPVTVHNVDAAVHEEDLPVALLGMSVLNRFEMRRQGRTLTLKRGY